MTYRRVSLLADESREPPNYGKLEELWKVSPTLEHLSWALQLARGTPRETWHILAVFALYVDLWSKHHERSYPSTGRIIEGAYESVRVLVNARGAGDAVRGIEVLFSENCAWVKQKSLDFLSRDDTWFKHVVPHLSALPSSTGEQAEFGKRGEKGYRKVEKL